MNYLTDKDSYVLTKLALGGDQFSKDLARYASKNPEGFVDVLLTFPTINTIGGIEELLIQLLTRPAKKINNLGGNSGGDVIANDDQASQSSGNVKKSKLLEFNPENLASDKMTSILNALPVSTLTNIFKSVDISNLHWLIECLYRKLFTKDLVEINDLDEIKKVHLWALSSKINKVYPALKRYTNLKILQYFAR